MMSHTSSLTAKWRVGQSRVTRRSGPGRISRPFATTPELSADNQYRTFERAQVRDEDHMTAWRTLGYRH
jgi:hypothetical protein